MNDKQMLKHLGKNIKEIRNKQNLSQKQLSQIAKVNKSYLSDVENGKKNPSFGYIIKISKGLKINIKNLFQF